jgi:hypothetical protein
MNELQGKETSHVQRQLIELSDWIAYQLRNWEEWTAQQGTDWIALPTQNERQKTFGEFFWHSFSPMHRYADSAIGETPEDDSDLDKTSWPILLERAKVCHARHREVCEMLSSEQADREVDFATRSAGILRITPRVALTHAALHCAWHLGGLVHMLRDRGIVPPQRSDFILWAIEAQKERAG